MSEEDHVCFFLFKVKQENKWWKNGLPTHVYYLSLKEWKVKERKKINQSKIE